MSRRPGLHWLPWQWLLRRLARTHGFLDPVSAIAHFSRFAQASEVMAPHELLRAGLVLHVRGLMNSQAIQHNLDWVWPYWVERQFDPYDASFVPRAFSLTHINLTHRNWTAVGVPNTTEWPIVDPRGLLTPFYDGWSLDAWIITDGTQRVIPSRSAVAEQRLEWPPLRVTTTVNEQRLQLRTTAWVEAAEEALTCRWSLEARVDRPAWLVVSVRPYNPEGVSFVHHISVAEGRRGWVIDGRPVAFDAPADRHVMSRYRAGDVYRLLPYDDHTMENIRCDVGLATAAALFRITPEAPRTVEVRVPLPTHVPVALRHVVTAPVSWEKAVDGCMDLRIPDRHMQFLFEAALRTVILHAPHEVYPGPYTYKRFWFRDAAFIMHALLAVGLAERAERTLHLFPLRQTPTGYFLSQNGEWDANGEALWIMHQWCVMTGQPPSPDWRGSIERAARWIMRKRLSTKPASPHAGLLPPGFSAEHLGPNDYYYWDDAWGVAGLRAAAALLRLYGHERAATQAAHVADDLLSSVERSLALTATRLGHAAMPASPYRRMDSGAIGSLVFGYPLRLWPADDPRLMSTVAYLVEQCLVHGGFFQEMSHSGINPYLTLHMAQVLLRVGDRRYFALMEQLASMASPTGQWPEAMHPGTRGGCMGDGQHVWAAAEWLLMLRNCVVREEGNRLILGSGIPAAWWDGGVTLQHAPTAFGPIDVSIRRAGDKIRVAWTGQWRGKPPMIEIRLWDRPPVTASPGQTSVDL